MTANIPFDRPARSSDPHSSWEAARLNRRSGSHSRQCDDALDALRIIGNRLDHEERAVTAAELGAQFGIDKIILRKRLPELMSRGLVEKGPQRKCRVAGTLAQTWRVI